MLDHVALILLGPVLFAQGKYVRRVAMQLPEPRGERAGRAGQGRDLGVLIIGDSAAAGVGVDDQQQALAGNVVTALHDRFAVRWRVCAESGDNSRQLLEKLHALPAEAFQVAVVSIGVNDVTALTRPGVWRENLRAIARVLSEKFGVRRVYFSSIPPMHLFPALPHPLRWWLGLRARRLSAVMRTVADAEEHCVYVCVPYSGDPAEIAADGFHPGPRAYRLWGEHIAALVCEGVVGQSD